MMCMKMYGCMSSSSEINHRWPGQPCADTNRQAGCGTGFTCCPGDQDTQRLPLTVVIEILEEQSHGSTHGSTHSGARHRLHHVLSHSWLVGGVARLFSSSGRVPLPVANRSRKTMTRGRAFSNTLPPPTSETPSPQPCSPPPPLHSVWIHSPLLQNRSHHQDTHTHNHLTLAWGLYLPHYHNHHHWLCLPASMSKVEAYYYYEGLCNFYVCMFLQPSSNP